MALQAIAMFGYGTEDCAWPSTSATGPGNVYVAAAKRLLRDRVSIDAEYGYPTEVAIVADDGADASFIAADLVAQAERHDPLLAACLLIQHRSAALADRKWTSSWQKRPPRPSTPNGYRRHWRASPRA